MNRDIFQELMASVSEADQMLKIEAKELQEQTARFLRRLDFIILCVCAAVCVIFVAADMSFGAAWFGFCAGSIFNRLRGNG